MHMQIKVVTEGCAVSDLECSSNGLRWGSLAKFSFLERPILDLYNHMKYKFLEYQGYTYSNNENNNNNITILT